MPTTYSIAHAERPTDQEKLKALPSMYDSSSLQSEQFEATSLDGTRVPYFLVSRKDAKLDGSTPTLLYGYGGFEISMTPGYAATVGVGWLEMGGAYAVANIRGGGEFGPRWHQVGSHEAATATPPPILPFCLSCLFSVPLSRLCVCSGGSEGETPQGL